MEITLSSITTQKGPPGWFTGDAYIDASARRHLDVRRCGRPLHSRRPHRLAHPLFPSVQRDASSELTWAWCCSQIESRCPPARVGS
jgi:hypothetical protein